jgi:hypothetical protein
MTEIRADALRPGMRLDGNPQRTIVAARASTGMLIAGRVAYARATNGAGLVLPVGQNG